jgi:hypothetical protein
MAKSFPNTGTTVIDATADLPGSPSEGMMVFQKDTNELKIYDGASWISMLDTDTPSGLDLIYSNAVTVAGAGETMVNNLFSSKYQNYKIIINMVSASIGDQLRMRLQTGGTSSATLYYIQQAYLDSNTALSGWTADGQANANDWRVCFPPASAALADVVTMDLMSPFAATQTTLAGTAIQDARYMRTLMGSHRVSTSYSGLAFTTFAGGSLVNNIRVYGYRNSI